MKHLRKISIGRWSAASVVTGAVMATLPFSAFAEGQAPMLDALVDAGTLPAWDERLPTDPMVLQPLDTIGSYGGEMRTEILGGTDRGYGWINRLIGYEPLVRWAPEGGRVIPNIAQSYQVNDESTQFTFVLREGMRWSDGAPVTADDIVFWYNDMALNEELFPGGPGTSMVVDGEPATVEKIDDLTVRFTFSKPYGLFLQQLASIFNVPSIAPAHYAKQFHPAYNPNVDEMVEASGQGSWAEFYTQKVGGPGNRNFAAWVNPELPVLNAWTVTQPYDGSSTQVIAERNPYYWKVDPEDNQLPYLDQVVFPIIGDSEVLKLMVMNGQLDFTYRPQNITVADKPTLFDAMESGDFRFIDLSPDLSATQAIHLNLATLDLIKNELFNTKDFRVALSHAINRQEIIDIVYIGQGEPFQVASRPESAFYDEEFAKQFTEFDPDMANSLLDGIGLTERDGRGIRVDKEGNPISIQVDVRTENRPQIDGLELIRGYWADIGIELRINVIDSGFYRERQVANLFEAISNVGAGGLNEMLNSRLYVPINDNALYGVPWAQWYTGDPRGIEPPASTLAQLELYDQFLATADPVEQERLFREVLEIAKEEFRTIGISLISGTYAIASNRMGNMPQQMIASAIYPTPAPMNPQTWYVKSE